MSVFAPFYTNGVASLYQADARALPLPDKSVHMCVTSPPYWGLRDYQLEESGIGLEPTLGEWVENIVAVGREVWHVLRDDGTFWLNLGDAYASNPSNGRGGGSTLGGGVPHLSGSDRAGANLPPKNLMGQPWRAAFALQDDGWILRSAIVWHKPNPMPESVTDRPTNSYEMVFLFAKQGRYFYDAEAIKESASSTGPRHPTLKQLLGKEGEVRSNGAFHRHNVPFANARNVWTIPTQGYPGAHFATFPEELPRRCILAGTSEKGVCSECGNPWVRVVEREYKGGHNVIHTARASTGVGHSRASSFSRDGMQVDGGYQTQTLGWEPTCECDAPTVPATVLDPFVGSGTTLAVAQSLGRKGVGTDLNPEYLQLAAQRIGKVTLPMMV